jgi:hypothetical protein
VSEIAVECESCGAAMAADTSHVGKRVRCPQCKNVMTVRAQDPEPEALKAVVESSPPRRDRDPRKRRKGGTTLRDRRGTTVRRKAGGSPDTAVRRRDGPPQGKSPVPLILGVVGLLAVVAVVATVLLTGGKGDGGDAELDEGEGTGRSAKSSGKKGPSGKEEREREYLVHKASARSAEDFLTLGEEAESLGRSEDAKKHFLKAVELDPDFVKVREKLGFTRYSLPPAASNLPEELLEGLQAEVGGWKSKEDLAALRKKEARVLEAARAEVEKRRSDPFHAHTAKILKDLATIKGLEQYQFVHRRSDPYLLFEHAGRKGRSAYRSKEAIALLDQKVEAIKLVFRFVIDNFIEPSGLSRDENVPLVIISFEDRAIMDEYHRSIGLSLPPGALAYFSPRTKYVVMYNGEGGQFGQEASDSTLFHEATHQIFDAFANPGGGYAVRLSTWFNEGMAEYIASLRLKPRQDGSGTFEHLIAYEMKSSRLAEFYAARFPMKFRERKRLNVGAAYNHALKEMVQIFTPDQGMQIAMGKWMRGGGRAPSGPELQREIFSILGSLIYAEASSFMFFCFKGKPEKYKAKMMKYLKAELKGQRVIRGAQTFREIFGDDLDGLNEEWLEYVDSITTVGIKEGRLY